MGTACSRHPCSRCSPRTPSHLILNSRSPLARARQRERQGICNGSSGSPSRCGRSKSRAGDAPATNSARPAERRSWDSAARSASVRRRAALPWLSRLACRPASASQAIKKPHGRPCPSCRPGMHVRRTRHGFAGSLCSGNVQWAANMDCLRSKTRTPPATANYAMFSSSRGRRRPREAAGASASGRTPSGGGGSSGGGKGSGGDPGGPSASSSESPHGGAPSPPMKVSAASQAPAKAGAHSCSTPAL